MRRKECSGAKACRKMTLGARRGYGLLGVWLHVAFDSHQPWGLALSHLYSKTHFSPRITSTQRQNGYAPRRDLGKAKDLERLPRRRCRSIQEVHAASGHRAGRRRRGPAEEARAGACQAVPSFHDAQRGELRPQTLESPLSSLAGRTSSSRIPSSPIYPRIRSEHA